MLWVSLSVAALRWMLCMRGGASTFSILVQVNSLYSIISTNIKICV